MADLCPFTLKPLASIKREELAVVYASNPLLSDGSPVDGASNATVAACGHSCSLIPLVSYLHNSGGTKTCPVCQKSPASVVCDAQSSAFLMQQKAGGGADASRIVSFRHGTTSYFLWAQPPLPNSIYHKLFSQRTANAVYRIGQVLGMDAAKGLKVIHKGKVVYPNNAGAGHNSDEVSAQLLDISSADLTHRRKKPSLVVTGLRRPLATTSTLQKASNLLFSVAKLLTPKYICNALLWVLHYTFCTANALAGGVWLFARSLFYPPQPMRP